MNNDIALVLKRRKKLLRDTHCVFLSGKRLTCVMNVGPKRDLLY